MAARTFLWFPRHPRGLVVCFLTEMWERFSFYGMKALLFFYVTKHHLFSDAEAYLLLGTYGGLAYALPVLGGLVADRWLGTRFAVVLGGLLLAAGHAAMSWEGAAASLSADGRVQDQAALQVFYLALALIVTGVGLLKPAISTLVGQLYAADDPRRDAGFTWFYMGINLGAFSAALLCGWLGESWGWSWGFGLAGAGMLVGVITFVAGRRHFGQHGAPPRPLTGAMRGLSVMAALVVAVLVWRLLQARWAVLDRLSLTATEAVALVAATVLLIWWTRFVMRSCNPVERGRMIRLMVLIAVSTLFWGLYEQSYGSWNAFTDRVVDRSALGIDWRASQLTALGAFFIFLLAPFFAWLWPTLDRQGRNPSELHKFALALGCAGLAMGVLALAAQIPLADGRVTVWALVAAYAVLTIGEMLLSPIGLAAVTRLSVPTVAGLMMGVWFLASAFGEMLAGRLGTLAAVDPGTPLSLDALRRHYAEVFAGFMALGGLSGLLLWVLAARWRDGAAPTARASAQPG